MRWNKSRYTFLICSNSRIFVHTIMHIILKQMETHYYHTFKTHKLLQSFELVQNIDKHSHAKTHKHSHMLRLQFTVNVDLALYPLPIFPFQIFPFLFGLINCLCIFFLPFAEMITYGVPILICLLMINKVSGFGIMKLEGIRLNFCRIEYFSISNQNYLRPSSFE